MAEEEKHRVLKVEKVTTKDTEAAGTKKAREQRKERRKMERDMELALSSGDDDDVAPARAKASGRLKPKPSTLAKSTGGKRCAMGTSRDDRFQPGDIVEARFGGRSRWFVGKIRRAYQDRSGEVLYDIAYDDGDKEEGVLGGRVRRPGQSPPALRQSAQVEIKLARKGKVKQQNSVMCNQPATLYRQMFKKQRIFFARTSTGSFARVGGGNTH